MNIKKIIGIVVLIIGLITGIWQVDDRYISAAELAQTKDKIYLKIDTSEYRFLTEQLYKFKILVRENPANKELKEQLKEIEDDRKVIKKRIDENLRNGQ